MSMPRRLRFFPDRMLVEVTARTLQGRFLLKPSAGLREIFIGILARAAERYDVAVHAFVCLSNHYHLLCSPADAQALASFMLYVNTNLSKEAGRLHRWRGPLLQRRYQAILVSDEDAAQIGRLRYLLSHGVKESLVARVDEWPGAHCGRALVTGEAPLGVWFDRTKEHAARHRGDDYQPADFATYHRLDLAPLPCWRHLPPERVRQCVAEILGEVEADAAQRHAQAGTRPLGAAGILRQDSHERPACQLAPKFPPPFAAKFPPLLGGLLPPPRRWELWESAADFQGLREGGGGGAGGASFPQTGSFHGRDATAVEARSHLRSTRPRHARSRFCSHARGIGAGVGLAAGQ
jgi:REP element-mobilizing transposase RayT